MDLTSVATIQLADGSTATALEIQWELFGAARHYAKARGSPPSATRPAPTRCSNAGSRSSRPRGRSDDPRQQLDWVAKRQIMEAYRERHGCGWDDGRLAALDLQYHDLRPERSLYARLGMERLLTDEQVARP